MNFIVRLVGYQKPIYWHGLPETNLLAWLKVSQNSQCAAALSARHIRNFCLDGRWNKLSHMHARPGHSSDSL